MKVDGGFVDWSKRKMNKQCKFLDVTQLILHVIENTLTFPRITKELTQNKFMPTRAA